MKNFIYTFLFLAIIGLLASCSDVNTPDIPKQSENNFEDGFEFSLFCPDLEDVATRTLAGSPTKSLEDMDLYLFLFDGPYLLQTIHIPADDTDRIYDEAPQHLKFKTQLAQTDNDATIHIVALDDSAGNFATQIDEVGYGIEDTVMPSFYTSNDQDAYWQRIELKTPIIVSVDNSDNGLDNVEGTEQQVRAALANSIPLIRNFAKISLKKADNYSEKNAQHFEILGWTIVNDRDRGSVVPWYSINNDPNVKYPEYYDAANKKGKSYDDLTNLGYHGVSQPNAQLRHRLSQIGSDGSNWGTDDKFLYERRISSVNPLYILLYGKYGDLEPGYYKLALGHTDEATGLFTEYNVLRNIEYQIVIDKVADGGAKTPADAAAGAAFNNVSGDVITKNLTSISDGVDMLYVNFINYVVTTDNQTVDFKYRYRTNITSTPAKYDNTKVFNLDLKEGEVIHSVTIGTTDDSDGWRTVHIEFNNPTQELKQQSFTIYSVPDPNNPNGTIGLSRTINLILRQPWNFVRMETFPGRHNDDTKWPDYDPDDELKNLEGVDYFVGANKGAPLTIFFELPSGLPEAIFPLDFTFESDRQNIENDGIGTAVVQSGVSLFPNVYDHRISYRKTVTWQDYTGEDNETSTEQSRIQRARFVTTTAISSLPGNAYTTTVILHNDYFNDITDQFRRDQGKEATPAN